MKVGDRVQVIESVIVYTHPEHRNKPFDIKGMEGEVINILQDWNGRPISPNLPVVVKFLPKFKAHLRDNELNVI